MFKITEPLSYPTTLDTLRASCRTLVPHYKLGGSKCFIIFTFYNLISDMVFGMTNSFSGIYDAVSSEKSYSTSFVLTYIKFKTVKFFLPAQS